MIVDGTNVLHALAAARGTASRLPEAALVGRLRAVVPASVAVEIVLDGPPDRGLTGRRLAAGVAVRHSGRLSADEVIVGLVAGAARAPGARPAVLVVTDDRALGAEVGRHGAEVRSSTWLLDRLARMRLTSPATGRPRPPAHPLDGKPDSGDDDRRPWRPGRGATRKRGNPRRRPRGGPATMPR
jgi:hypothetical protein